MFALWGLGQMSLSKYIVVVDGDVDVQNTDTVMFYVGANVDPERDIQIVRGPVDVLDHASNMSGFGGKMGIDATRKWPTEGFTRPWPKKIATAGETARRADQVWQKISKGWKPS